ncbi:MAG: adenylyltransferase/cytidyltransferase family protein [Candidatus Omnitrophica bacterium]|jgi:cytidyltransferase-like protein|nr:adenylyltransferase/cytidyltransferase family protein [Candidatus Omnitrophota bacterium]
MKIVYSYYVLDIVHTGHLLMMQNAKAVAGNDGKLIVGILTDQCVLEKKGKKPVLSFPERIELAKAIKYVDVVVAQETYSPLSNLKEIQPDVLMESSSHSKVDIEEYRRYMESIGGKVIVLPYYPSQSSSNIKNSIKKDIS